MTRRIVLVSDMQIWRLSGDWKVNGSWNIAIEGVEFGSFSFGNKLNVCLSFPSYFL
jgi:hypothetical protein